MPIEEVSVRMLPDGRMNTKNAALYLGFTEVYLRFLRMKGKGPEYVKVGRRAYYFKSDMDEWITERGDA